ncbi:hypothetical protein FIV42_07030 [Persicimonas caeni]|uniref:Uncharacterized protein n=1 Tax=Persicimonas caeni TaxID=2292766 RepID=A0A4Y6PQ79_PERCE|nr:hypothetical protein [Persicimonas caeni]QDG50492.1 hypothetical protein FIV42_07030 [Persicimonas caeni]QED31713.1 hypothetical protein FRD00_07025 [Persicimonas caeni]
MKVRFLEEKTGETIAEVDFAEGRDLPDKGSVVHLKCQQLNGGVSQWLVRDCVEGTEPIVWCVRHAPTIANTGEAAQDELWAVSHLYQQLPLSLTAQWKHPIQATESPDFLIKRRDGSVLGIEVTSLTDQKRLELDVAKAQIRKTVRAWYRQRFGANLVVEVDWSTSARWLPVDALTAELIAILEHLPKVPPLDINLASFDVSDIYEVKAKMELVQSAGLSSSCPSGLLPEWKVQLVGKLKSFPQYIDRVRFAIAPDGLEYPTVTGGFLPTVTPTSLGESRQFKKKEKKLTKRYLHRCDECWLLVHAWYSHVENSTASMVEVDHEAFEREILDSQFDRVWLLDGGFGLYEAT